MKIYLAELPNNGLTLFRSKAIALRTLKRETKETFEEHRQDRLEYLDEQRMDGRTEVETLDNLEEAARNTAMPKHTYASLTAFDVPPTKDGVIAFGMEMISRGFKNGMEQDIR